MTAQPDFLHLLSVLSSCLYSFLGTEALVALDSACVNEVIRKRFLASLTNRVMKQVDCTKLSLDWIVRRKVLPGKIYVFKTMSEIDAILLSEVTSSVQEIRVDCSGQRLITPTIHLIVNTLVRYCPQLQRLIWHTDKEWHDGRYWFSRTEHVLFLANACPSLTDLTIHNANFKLTNFRTVLHKCKYLTTIDICECKRVIDGRGLESVAELCPHLESLAISHSNRISEGVLHLIATSCRKLTSFRIEEKMGLFQNNEISPVGFADFALHCPSLHTLHLFNIHMHYADVYTLATRCQCLRDLSLGSFTCVGAPSDWFQQVIAFFPHLQTLQLAYDTGLSDEDVCALAQLCPTLRSVDVSELIGLSEHTITAIVEHCPQLQNLCWDSVFLGQQTTLYDTIAHHCALLQKLHLFFGTLTQPALLVLAQHCPLLEDLSFGCEEDADFGPAAVYLVNLRHLHICSTNPSDQPVLSFVSHCRQLRTLHAEHYFYPFRSVRVVRAIERNCPRLSLFRVSKCTRGVYKALTRLRLQRARGGKTDFTFTTEAIATCLICWTFDPEPLYW